MRLLLSSDSMIVVKKKEWVSEWDKDRDGRIDGQRERERKNAVRPSTELSRDRPLNTLQVKSQCAPIDTKETDGERNRHGREGNEGTERGRRHERGTTRVACHEVTSEPLSANGFYTRREQSRYCGAAGVAALQSHSSFRGQSGTDGGGEPREDLGWGKLNRSHGERSVGREQAHAHESKGGEPRERPMPGVHATRRGTRLTLRYLAFPCPSLARVVSPPLPLSRTLLFFSPPLPPSFLLLLPLLLFFAFSTTFAFLLPMYRCCCCVSTIGNSKYTIVYRFSRI